MAESTLSLAFLALGREVSHYLGWGRKGDAATDGLTAAKAAHVVAVLNAGYRKFLTAHDWSFLYPLQQLVLFGPVAGVTSGAQTTTITASTAVFYPAMVGHTIRFTSSGNTYTITSYTSATAVVVSSTAAAEGAGAAFTMTPTGANRLPDNFGGLYGDKVRFVNNSGAWAELPITSEGIVGSLLQDTTSSGRPKVAALRPISTDHSGGQRWDLVAWPVCDSNHTVNFRMMVNPDALTLALGSPYGGMQFAEALRKACLAAAEEMFNDGQTDKQAEWLRALEDAKRRDRRSHQADTIGVAGDAEPFCDEDYARRINTVSVGGVYYP